MSARRCAATTTSPARTAATATASPRAPTSALMFAELLGTRAGLLPGQGRLDAHRRPRERQPRRERDRRRLDGHRDRRGVLGEAPRHRPGRRLLLRRRRARPGAPLRGHEHGRALEAAGRLRLREQPLRRVHARPRGDGRRRSSTAAEGVRHRRRARSTARTSARSSRRRASSSRAPARGEGPAFLLCNTYRYHGHHVGDVDRAYYRRRTRSELWQRRARPDSRCTRTWLARSRGWPTTDELTAIEAEARDERRARRRVRARRAVPRAERGDRGCLRLASRADRDARDHDRAGGQRGARRGAAPRRARVRDRRGRRRGGHAVQGAVRARRGVRAGADPRLADLRGRHHRARRRRGDDRPAPGRRHHVRRLPDARRWTSSRTRRRRCTTCRAAS